MTNTATAAHILVTGSIATDHLMSFPGKFTDSLLPDQLHRVSLSFLVDDLVIHRGGVAANICFAMGTLGQHPVLVDAVGYDFAEYGQHLSAHGIDVDHVLHCADVATARFVCTTDEEMNQIGSFYAGAMARANAIDIGTVADEFDAVNLVMISAGDPQAMAQHAQACRERGIPFGADPSQQLARLTGEQARELVTGAEILFSNDYELGLLKSKTGWSDDDIAAQVACRVITRGADGIDIVSREAESIHVAVVPETGKVDPTGVGDAFRGGFLAGRLAGLDLEHCGQLGALMATLVLETVGTQNYVFDAAQARGRLAHAYGHDAADTIATAVGLGE